METMPRVPQSRPRNHQQRKGKLQRATTRQLRAKRLPRHNVNLEQRVIKRTQITEKNSLIRMQMGPAAAAKISIFLTYSRGSSFSCRKELTNAKLWNVTS